LPAYFNKFENQVERAFNIDGTVLRLTKTVIVAALEMHMMACLWWYIADLEHNQDPDNGNWIWRETAKRGWDVSVYDFPEGDQYLYCFYYVIVTTFGVGYGDITPVTRSETVFICILILLAAALFAAIVATMTAVFKRVDIMDVEQRRVHDCLVAYIKSRKLQPDIRDKMLQGFEYQFTTKSGQNESTVYKEMPRPLRQATALFLSQDMLNQVKCFRKVMTAFKNEMIYLFTPRLYTPDDVVIRMGEYAREAMFLRAGRLHKFIMEKGRSQMDLGKAYTYVGVNAVLRRGFYPISVKSKTYSNVFVLEVDAFHDLLNKYTDEKNRLLSFDFSKEKAGF
jgi:hypothetical protein